MRSTTFRALVADCPDTLHVVARFLALLELYRDSAVVFEQLDALGELHVRWTGSDEGELAIDDEFDDPPDGESDTESDIGAAADGADGADVADDADVADGTGTIDLTERGPGPVDRGGGPVSEHEDAVEVPAGEGPGLSGSLEAILLVVDEPVADVVLAQVLQEPQDAVRAALEALREEYDGSGRGFELREVAGGWRFYTRPEYAGVVERFVLDGQQARLTQASLETLAVVAYRQPVSRARVSAVRGVNVDGVMRTLLTRGLVEECGTDSESGALLYRTTSYFLERLGLGSLEELPPLGPYLPDIESLDVDSVSFSG